MLIGHLLNQPFKGVQTGLDSPATLPRTSHRDGGWTMTSTQGVLLVLVVVAGLMVSCATAPSSSEDKRVNHGSSDEDAADESGGSRGRRAGQTRLRLQPVPQGREGRPCRRGRLRPG